MRFIKKVNLERDLENVPNEVRKTAESWLTVIENKETQWSNFFDIRDTYSSVSRVGELYVFNVKEYRLIVGINFTRRIVYYKTIMSHPEYMKKLWISKFSRPKLAKSEKKSS